MFLLARLLHTLLLLMASLSDLQLGCWDGQQPEKSCPGHAPSGGTVSTQRNPARDMPQVVGRSAAREILPRTRPKWWDGQHPEKSCPGHAPSGGTVSTQRNPAQDTPQVVGRSAAKKQNRIPNEQTQDKYSAGEISPSLRLNALNSDSLNAISTNFLSV